MPTNRPARTGAVTTHWDARPHWSSLDGVVARTLLLAALALLAWQRTDGRVEKTLLLTLGALLAASAVHALGKAATWYSTRLTVTDTLVITRSGLLARRYEETPLERVENITIEQSIPQRLLRTGNVTIETRGGHRQSALNVKRPDQLRELLTRLTRRT